MLPLKATWPLTVMIGPCDETLTTCQHLHPHDIHIFTHDNAAAWPVASNRGYSQFWISYEEAPVAAWQGLIFCALIIPTQSPWQTRGAPGPLLHGWHMRGRSSPPPAQTHVTNRAPRGAERPAERRFQSRPFSPQQMPSLHRESESQGLGKLQPAANANGTTALSTFSATGHPTLFLK